MLIIVGNQQIHSNIKSCANTTRLIIPHIYIFNHADYCAWDPTSAFTIHSMIMCSESLFLQVDTPSNWSCLCFMACSMVTSRLLYVFSAARFYKQNRFFCVCFVSYMQQRNPAETLKT